ncbi:MAG: hypothetical protein MUF22_00535 [Chitinispirillaceae bacterium]|nr:hypothetical protein [Chitinispirillaceae bacterium]
MHSMRASRALVIPIITVVWLLVVNGVFFWHRFGQSSLVARLIERLGF